MYHLIKSIYLHATSLPEYSILLLGLDAAGKTTLHNQIKALFSATADPDHPTAASSTAGKTVPTVGQNVSVVALPDLYLRIWDVGGQHALRGLWQSYYSSCHAIVFVIDSTDIGDADISKLMSGSGGGGAAQQGGGGVGGQPQTQTHGLRHGMDGTKTAMPPAFARSFSTVGMPDDDRLGRLAECRAVLESVLAHSDAEGVPLLVLANKQDREDCVEVVRIKEGFVRKVFEGEKGGSVRDSRVLPCSALTGTGVKEAVEWLCSRVKWNKEARPPVMR